MFSRLLLQIDTRINLVLLLHLMAMERVQLRLHLKLLVVEE